MWGLADFEGLALDLTLDANIIVLLAGLNGRVLYPAGLRGSAVADPAGAQVPRRRRLQKLHFAAMHAVCRLVLAVSSLSALQPEPLLLLDDLLPRQYFRLLVDSLDTGVRHILAIQIFVVDVI